jgi:hypothetical protein
MNRGKDAAKHRSPIANIGLSNERVLTHPLRNSENASAAKP